MNRIVASNAAQSKTALNFDYYLNYYTDTIVRTIRRTYGPAEPIDPIAIREMVSEHLLRHIGRGASRFNVAVHEAGHFVSQEAEGLCALTAVIKGTRGSAFGWTGWASLARDVWLGPNIPLPNPDDLISFARAMVSGPVAEELIGNGDAFANFAELMRAHVYSDRAAGLLNELSSVVWAEIVSHATTTVEQYALQISTLADMLDRRRKITRMQPSVRRVLKTITPHAPITGMLSPVGAALSQRIISGISSTASFMKETAA